MAYEVFTWCPLIEPEGASSFKVLSAQFGDGYKQSVGDGINNESFVWPLQFMGNESYIKEIRDFLRRHQGFMPFEWTPPMEESAMLFEVVEYRLSPLGAGMYNLSASFQQRFAP